MGKGAKGRGSESIPRKLPSNFSAVVAPMVAIASSHTPERPEPQVRESTATFARATARRHSGARDRCGDRHGNVRNPHPTYIFWMLAIVFVGACGGCVLQRVCCVWLQTTLYFQSIDIDKSDTEASLVCAYCFTSCLFTIIEVQGRRDYFFGEISVLLKLNYN